MITSRIIGLVLGYVFGLFPTGKIVGKAYHTDLRKSGSGNTGMTNSIRVLGWKAGVIVFFGDCLKAAAAMLIVWLIYRDICPEAVKMLELYAGVGAVLGHNFPLYARFKGGKGIAATSGVALSLLLFPKHCWVFAVFGLITFASVTLISKYVSLGSLVFITLFLIEFLAFGAAGWLPLTKLEAYGILICLTVLAYIRHRGNIGRLMHGTERKIGHKA